jgi:hypothetical protein
MPDHERTGKRAKCQLAFLQVIAGRAVLRGRAAVPKFEGKDLKSREYREEQARFTITRTLLVEQRTEIPPESSSLAVSCYMELGFRRRPIQ